MSACTNILYPYLIHLSQSTKNTNCERFQMNVIRFVSILLDAEQLAQEDIYQMSNVQVYPERERTDIKRYNIKLCSIRPRERGNTVQNLDPETRNTSRQKSRNRNDTEREEGKKNSKNAYTILQQLYTDSTTTQSNTKQQHRQ
jgi:hypothetical protein